VLGDVTTIPELDRESELCEELSLLMEAARDDWNEDVKLATRKFKRRLEKRGDGFADFKSLSASILLNLFASFLNLTS